jgi:hypothetical protein
MLAHGQVPKDASLSLVVQLINDPGLLNTEARRNTLLGNSTLSMEQIRVVLDTVGQAIELQNLEGNAARMQKQPGADFTAIERQRREILSMIAVNLEQRLGADGWAKFNSFLQSIEQQMKVHRSLCDNSSIVYTFGTTLQNEVSTMTAIAVADVGDYRARDSRLYAEATVTSPENREITARSPANPLRIHVAAIAPLDIGLEDGTYKSSYRFGEFCGGSAAPRLFTDRVN